jgi:hypothetical protein
LSTSLAVHYVGMCDSLLFVMNFTFPGVEGPAGATAFARKIVEDILRHFRGGE